MNDSACAIPKKERKIYSFVREVDYSCFDIFLSKRIKKIILFYRSPEKRIRRNGFLGRLGFKSLYWQEREIEVEGDNIEIAIKEGDIVQIFFADRELYHSLKDYDCRTITKVCDINRASAHNPYEFRVPMHNVRRIECE